MPANSLFDKVISILEEVRSGVVRSINSGMVIASLLGDDREIMLELQGGDSRIEYESKSMNALAEQLLLLELGRGFSFVAWQKHISFDDDDFYVDSIFCNSC